MSRLLKVELIRFLKSFGIVKYAFIASIIVFFIPAIEFLNLENGQLNEKIVWSAIGVNTLYIATICAGVIGVYIGREFSQKTLYYEVMSGFKPVEICVSKIMSGGLFLSILLSIGMILYFLVFPVNIDKEFIFKIFFLWMIILHYSSCTTLYVLLSRSGIIGGCLSFIRFVLLEGIVLSILGVSTPDILEMVIPFLTTKQWLFLSESVLEAKYVFSILASFIGELLVLIILVNISMRKKDFV